MTKRICFLMLLLVVIFWFWVSFANPIAVPEPPKVCYKLNNVEIDNYNVVIVENYTPKNKTKNEEISLDDAVDWFYIIPKETEVNAIVLKNYASKNKTKDEEIAFDGSVGWFHIIPEEREESIIVPKFFVPKVNECIRLDHEEDLSFRDLYFGKSINVLLIDKDVDMSDITEELLDNDAIFVWKLWDSDCYIDSDCDEMEMYDIINNDGNYELVLAKIKNFGEMRTKLKKFPFYWGLAVILETLILFFIAKFFWRKYGIIDEIWWERNEISNKKLLLFWVIPTTVTLPLLWFVLPLIMWDWISYIIVWEFLVAISEATMIKYWLNVSWKKSIIVSIVCNVFSFAILWWGSLIMNDMNDDFEESIILMSIYLLVLYFLIEFAVLCISGKMLWNGEQIPNKRLILTWIIAPIIMILSLFAFALFMWFLVQNWLDLSVILTILAILAILVSLFIEMLLIKNLLKVSWKKSIVMSVFSILCSIAIVFLVIVLFDL